MLTVQIPVEILSTATEYITRVSCLTALAERQSLCLYQPSHAPKASLQTSHDAIAPSGNVSTSTVNAGSAMHPWPN